MSRRPEPGSGVAGERPDAIVFVGPMGAGKSSVGRRTARLLSVPFTDTDTEIVRVHGPIADIFAAHGEAHFRGLERDSVNRALATGGVVALGGGAVLAAETRELLRGARVVLLTVDEKTIARRIRGGKRPLLSAADDPVAEWKRIRDERAPLYEEVADVTFDTSHGPIQQTVEAVVAWARADPAAREETTETEEDR